MIAECADQGQEEGSEPRAPQPEKKGSGAGQLLTTLTVLAFLRALPRQLRMEGAACGRQGGLPQGAGGEGWCCLDPALASALPLASPLSGFPGRGHRYSCGCIPCPHPTCVSPTRAESQARSRKSRKGWDPCLFPHASWQLGLQSTKRPCRCSSTTGWQWLSPPPRVLASWSRTSHTHAPCSRCPSGA